MVLSATTLVILGVIAPVIISYLTSCSMSVQAKQLIALGVSIVLAVIIAVVSGGVGLVFTAGWVGFFESFAIALPSVFTIQQLVYNFIFKNTEFAIEVRDNHGIGKNEAEPGYVETEDLSNEDNNIR